MAKQFAGFTPQQTASLLQKMGYSGPVDSDAMQQFIAANPAAAARLGKYTETAQRMIAGQPAAKAVPPSSAMSMQKGGLAKKPLTYDEWLKTQNFTPRQISEGVVDPQSMYKKYTQSFKPTTDGTTGGTKKTDTTRNLDPAKEADGRIGPEKPITPAKPTTEQKIKKGQQDILETAYTEPEKLITEAKPPTISKADEAAGLIGEDVGKLGAEPKFKVTKATTTTAAAPKPVTAATVQATKATPEVEKVVEETKAATGEVSPEAQVTAQTMEASSLAQLGLTAAQIEEAQTVKAPPPRELQAGELISGPTVDMARVESLMSNVQAAEATPSAMATVQGQMDQLMKQFEGSQPPAWAAGAMRAATAALAARGLGASSMAGQAVVQAAMESALPIAMADAQTRASFEAQNLSNRQQVAMFAAQQRANFLNMEFDQAFQTRVQNAARIADIANMNFNADVQIALENSRNAQSVDLANLNAKNAKILADAAAMTQLDMANLNNRQQAAVQNAQAFLQMDMLNLSNEQQTTMFNAQARIQALLTDAAAENAAKQFNAASKNQVDQFNASLVAQISQFNTAQKNAMSQFNAGEVNSLAKFRAEMRNQRDIFEAQSGLVIAQSNAQWRQNIATTEFAAKQQANMQNAMAATGMTKSVLDNLWQRERDLMAFIFQASENAADRETNLLLQKMDDDAAKAIQKIESRYKLVYDAFKSIGDIF